MQSLSSVEQSIVRGHGYENALMRLEIIKRNDAFLVELVKIWTSHHKTEFGEITKNNREVIATIFPCLDQNQPYAAPPTTIAGAVAWTKAMSTRIGVTMSVNLPN